MVNTCRRPAVNCISADSSSWLPLRARTDRQTEGSVGVEVSARRSATLPGPDLPLCVGGVYGRSSRSAVSGALLVPWTRTSTGQRSWAAYGPTRTWNRLRTALRSPELSLGSFKRQLKTHSSVPALDSAGCSCGCRVPSSHRRCCDCTASSMPTTNVLQTRHDST